MKVKANVRESVNVRIYERMFEPHARQAER